MGVSTPHVLLALLAGGSRHGYDLKRAHDERLPRARPLAFGQVYATLARLQRDGLVFPTGQEREGGPERTTYALTAEGRTALEEWLSTVERPMPYVGSALFAKAVVALLVTDANRARSYLIAQRRAHTERLRELTAAKTAPGATLDDIVAADFAIAHLDADLRWLQATLDRVADWHREVHA